MSEGYSGLQCLRRLWSSVSEGVKWSSVSEGVVKVPCDERWMKTRQDFSPSYLMQIKDSERLSNEIS